jgi:hypothetical protein
LEQDAQNLHIAMYVVKGLAKGNEERSNILSSFVILK